MQFGVEHRHFVCSGTIVERGSNPAAVSGASLRLELYHFPVTLWGHDDGTAWFTNKGAQTLFLDVQKLGSLIQMGEIGEQQLGSLDLISGSLQVLEYGQHYDLECRKASVS